MLARITGYLRHFGLCNFVSKDTTDPFATSMHLQHHSGRRRPIHAEKSLQHIDDEFHWSVVIVEQYDAIQRRLRRLRWRLFDNDAVVRAIGIFVLRHVQFALSQNRSGIAAHLSWKSNPLRVIGVSARNSVTLSVLSDAWN
jgi:hypothetical protein